jgi:hypothetical protein
MYFISYLLMAISIAYIGEVFNRVEET